MILVLGSSIKTYNKGSYLLIVSFSIENITLFIVNKALRYGLTVSNNRIVGNFAYCIQRAIFSLISGKIVRLFQV